MADLTSMLSEFVGTMIMLVTKPFTVCKLACMFAIRTISVVVNTWVELIRAVISFHLNLFWRFCMWSITFMSLPVRILTSPQRERQLELRLIYMQNDLENLVWDRKELQDRLNRAVKERRLIESMLTELEEEHEKAISKIESLETELKDLRKENFRLNEVRGKEAWSYRRQDVAEDIPYTSIPENSGIAYGIPSWKSSHKDSGNGIQDLMTQEDAWIDTRSSKSQLLDLPTPTQPVFHSTDSVIASLDVPDLLEGKRDAALSQTLFSAILSILVGMIIWEAEDPCMPLVVALFSVVGMSLKSVVQFFSTIKNKPASDAVALLSFNWFILGTLTYPTLPRVARMLAPFASNLAERTLSRFFVSSS